jgi:pSer/pThr/pTyr-binding forkhead associated (FHA) protein
MSARLVPVDEGPMIPLDRPVVFVGRHPECDIRIESKKISRRHCCIVQLHDRLMIRDLGSTNGIYCNGERVDEAVITTTDEVQIGNLRYRVVLDDADPIARERVVAPDATQAGIDANGDDDEPLVLEPQD